ncbi:hypothetical protein BIU82_06575 [Arthrobacter sp. SW1]|nr:hypothetical protein BIU82_06575 [Arthrobacter sp. SW1]
MAMVLLLWINGYSALFGECLTRFMNSIVLATERNLGGRRNDCLVFSTSAHKEEPILGVTGII